MFILIVGNLTLVLNLGDILQPSHPSAIQIAPPNGYHKPISRAESTPISMRESQICRPKTSSPKSHERVEKSLSTKSASSGSGSSSLSNSRASSPDVSQGSLKKQKASKESLQKFVSKHSQIGLSSVFPYGSTASMALPYSEEWMRKKQYLTINKHHTVRDVKFDAQGNILLSTRSSVQLYDNNGIFKEKLYQNRVGEPWGLYFNHQTGHILVADCEEQCVKEFNSIGIIVQEYGPVPSPRAVTVSTSGYVFVCSKDDACIYVYDKNAELVTHIGKGVLTAPTFITLHRKLILVSDQSKIIAFNLASEIEYVYGQSDESSHPSCHCVDSQTGYILATSYYKDTLIAFDQKMQRAVKIKSLNRPTICAISPFGNLLIGENSGRGTLLKMFKMR